MSSPPTDVPRRRRARRGEGDLLRSAILDAAGRLLAETGDETKVSIRAVADAVGVSPPSIYLHFPDKDALLSAVCNTRFSEFDEVLEAAGSAAEDPMESLRLRGRAYVQFGLDNPEHYRILFIARSEYGLGHPGHEAASRAFAHLVEAVQRCIDAGAITENNAFGVALTIWSMMHGLTSLLISRPAFPWPDIDELVDESMRRLASGLTSG